MRLRHWLIRWRARWTATDRILQQHEGGDAVILDTWTDVLMGCCDCGLMHRYDFSLVEGKLRVTARRDRVATLAVRRDRSFPFHAR